MKPMHVAGLVLIVAVVAIGLGSLNRKGPAVPQAPIGKVAAPDAPAEPAPPKLVDGSVLGEQAAFELAVYHLAAPAVDPVALARKLAAAQPSLRGEGVLEAAAVEAKDYAPPGPETLRYFGRGLSEEQIAALQGASRATRLRVKVAQPQARAALRAAESLVAEVAKQAGGLPWDEETRLCYSPQAWEEKLRTGWDGEAPVLPLHVAIHAYKKEKLVRAITLGMAKFGLPDLVAEDLDARSAQQMGTLLNLVGQTLVEAPAIPPGGTLALDVDSPAGKRVVKGATVRANAARKASIGLAVAEREEGDPENRLLRVVFPREAGQGLGEAQAALVGALFGTADAMKTFEHDPSLEAASAVARKRLVEQVKPLFLKGFDSPATLSVKAPFATDVGGTEWMWVEVHEWEGSVIKGRLQNEPFEIRKLHKGADVAFQEADAFDYLLERADGTSEGNQTGKLIEGMQGEQRRR